MVFAADLHLHTRYAFACSNDLVLTNMASRAMVKGIELLSIAGFTHPVWLSEWEANLVPNKEGSLVFEGVGFVAGSEISCVHK